MWSTVEYSAADAQAALEGDWSELFEANHSQPLSKSFVWFQAWNQSFGASYNITVICVRKDDQLVLVAPILHEQQNFQVVSLNSARLACNGYSPSCSMLISDSLVGGDLFRALKSLIDFVDVPLFRVPLISQSELKRLEALDRLGENYLQGVERVRVTPMIDVSGDWDGYLAGRSKSFRKGLRRKLKRIEATADVSVSKTILESSDDPLLDEIFRTSGRSWKAESGADLSMASQDRKFLLTLTDLLAAGRQVVIWKMRVGSDLVAFEFQIQFHGVAYPLRADYDAAFADISPGIVLLYHTIKDLFDDQTIVMYDSCADDYHYLTSWSQSIKEYSMLDLFARYPKPRLVHSIKYKLLPQLRLFKKNQA